MFDVGFSELVLLAIVALVVLGPEKLPHAARVAGAWVARIRRTISTVQAEIEREVSAQEMKTRMEKEFGASGIAGFTGNFVQSLQEEKTSIENDLKEAQNVIAPATIMAPDTPAVAITATPPAAVDAAPEPVLAEVATPLADVNMDGEAAYRQWLESQKRRNAPVTISNPDDSSDNPSGQTPA
ncbi:MAG: Sec-independent protein translocase protein TatB [Pedobacter sp.]|nr:Sec-independent protein translocase protein TatB [Pedobacter sp.]